MGNISVAVLTAAAVLAGGSTAALAQAGSGGSPSGQDMQGQPFGSNAPGIKRDWIPGQFSPAAERSGDPVQYNRTWPAGDVLAAGENREAQGQTEMQSRLNQRAVLRHQLRQAGYQNIWILNAAYLVQARMLDGRSVLMGVDLPPVTAPGATASRDRQNLPSGSARGRDGTFERGQQFGATASPGSASEQHQAFAPLLDPSQVRADLRARGFSNISSLSRDGYTYGATANWHSQQADVRVDGRTGFIFEPRPLAPKHAGSAG